LEFIDGGVIYAESGDRVPSAVDPWLSGRINAWMLTTHGMQQTRCSHHPSGVCRSCRWRNRRRSWWATLKRPYEIVKWDTPLVGIGWRADRRWDGLTCRTCHMTKADPDDVDPCLGVLPGVRFACCGHGMRYLAYIGFKDGTTVRGFRSPGDLGWRFRRRHRRVTRT
jgi:hypothetical protein